MLLLLFVGLLTAYLWMGTLSAGNVEIGHRTYSMVLEGRGGTPYQQRVLLPLLLGDMEIQPFTRSVTLLHLVLFPAWFVGLWLWLRRFGREALAVTVLSGLYIILGFESFKPVSSWSLVEMVCMVWLLVLIDRDITCLAIIIIATLNRPFTGATLGIVYLLYHGKQARPIAYLLVWLATYIGLFVMFPSNGWTMGDPVVHNLERNTGTFLVQGLMNNVLLLAMWILAGIGFYRTVPRLRRLAWVIPPYIVACLISATWYEMPRLMLTVYPIVGALMVVGMVVGMESGAHDN